MKAHEQFDEMARRKLAERDIPFDSADWDGMEQLLHGKRRRTAAWWWAGALALLIAGGAWWVTGHGEKEAVQVGVVEQKGDGPASLSTEVKKAEDVKIDGALKDQRAAIDDAAISEQAPGTSSVTGKRNADATTNGSPKSGREPKRQNGSALADAHDDATTKPGGHTVAGSIDAHSAQPSAPLSVEPAEQAGSSTAPDDPIPTVAATSPTGMIPPPAEPSIATTPSITDAGGAGKAADPNVPLQAGNNGPETPPLQPEADPPTVAVIAPDSATPAPSAPLARSSAAWAFEFRLLGGAYRTRPNYSGGENAKWNTSTATAPGFGAELRWGGEHLGIGMGVEHMSFRERVRMDEAFETSTSFPVTYNFISVDTTVLNVIDTVTVGGTLYYITQQVNTTIMVFDPDIDTVTTTTLSQQKIDRINTVRYVEIPLFFDLRKKAGRWSFGLCAGPTFGFLIGRDGALPGATPEATVDFNDQPFRGFKLGYAARVYARYQLGAKWSLGLEPSLRGHFGNEFRGGDLSRGSSGYGALLSISRTLR